MRIGVFGVIALGLLTAACGSNQTQRAATGGLTGLGAGALIGGPIGAVVGGAVGAAGGAVMPEGADTLAENALGMEHRVAKQELNRVGLGPSSGSSQVQSKDVVKQAQSELQREGLYKGRIDGIVGPQTRQALTQYQQREGLQQTAALDQATLDRMNLGNASAQTAQNRGMTTDQVRDQLQAEGYTNITDLHRRSDNTYTAHADQGSATYALKVDARSGRVVSQQTIASNQNRNAPAEGSSGTSSGTSGSNAPADSTGTNVGPNAGAGASGASGSH